MPFLSITASTFVMSRNLSKHFAYPEVILASLCSSISIRMETPHHDQFSTASPQQDRSTDPSSVFGIWRSGVPLSQGLDTTKLVLVVSSETLASEKVLVDRLVKRLAGHPRRVIYLVVIGGSDKVLQEDPPGLEQIELADLALHESPTDILVHTGTVDTEHDGLPHGLLRHLLEQDIRSVRQFTLDGVEWPYRLSERGKRRLLFVFPGPVFPIRMGSHRRAVNMLLSLLEGGFDTMVVYTGANLRERVAAEAPLSLISRAVDHYPNRKNKLAVWLSGVEDRLMSLLRRTGTTNTPKRESLGQRILLRNSLAYLRCLKRHDLEAFDVVFVNYVWLLPNVLRRRARRPLLVCDTLDVQFIRAFDKPVEEQDRIERFLMERARRREISLLSRADMVLSISQRDDEEFRKYLPDSKVVLAEGGFRHAYAAVRPLLALQPLRFGFFGTQMEANELALTEVLERWWPEISRWSPESRLMIAGSICKSAVLRRHAYLDGTVEPVGFVPTVASFYSRVDVLLSPVSIAGGINFKNAEAIASGVTVITNPLGAEAMALGPDLRVAQGVQDVLAVLRDIESNPEAEFARRVRLQTRLMDGCRIDSTLERINAALLE